MEVDESETKSENVPAFDVTESCIDSEENVGQQNIEQSFQSNSVAQVQKKPKITLIEIDASQTSESELTDTLLETPQDESEFSEMDIPSQPIPTVEYFIDKTVVELARISWRGSSKHQKFLKGCLWSPDGTCALTTINGDGMHVVELPADLYGSDSISGDRPVDVLQSAVHVKEGGVVYDYSWYPFMNSSDPASCCWLASRQHEPIQMWDAYKGSLRCTYRGYNAVDEVDAALSVTFSFDGGDVIGGYKNAIKIFRTDVPGRDYVNHPLKSPVSSLAINPNDNTIAAGSWNTVISLFDSRSINEGPYEQMSAHKGGITQIRFLSMKNMLISGARKDNQLLMWDLRNCNEPVQRLTRIVKTNQRIYFDVSRDEKWIVSGDTDGMIRSWNIENESNTEESKVNSDEIF